MSTEPLFDRSEIERIMHKAKVDRIKFLRRECTKVKGLTRWGAFAAVAAACLMLTAGRGIFHVLG